MKVTRWAVAAVVGLTVAIMPFQAPAHATTTQVIVQGGTTIRDSGLLANVITPGFQAAYPQYTLTFVAVGTGQALINAEAGQGDAVFTHNPAAEADFVAGGFSNEPYGRAVMVSDFITVGTNGDAAGVNAAAPHQAVKAFKTIAAAGASGIADFVSRGDASGTNLKELQIWALTGIPLNVNGEPGTPGTTDTASWYHKAGVGQAAMLSITNQCNFSSHHCYTLVDRGTFNYLAGQSPSTVANLSLVSDRNDAPALGGPSLLVNPYHAYAVKPGTTPATVNIDGAMAFLDYLTSPAFQTAVANYPSASAPAFTPDARPKITITKKLPARAPLGTTISMAGTVRPNFPLSPQLTGAPVQLVRSGAPNNPVATDRLSSKGRYQFTFKARQSDDYTVVFPQYQDRRSTSLLAGHLRVTG